MAEPFFAIILLILAALAFAASLASILDGRRIHRLVRRSRLDGVYAPSACLVIPCRGAEPGLHGNLKAYLEQDYPRYRAVVAVDDPGDPAVAIARRAAEESQVDLRIVTAEVDPSRSGKVSAQLAGLGQLGPEDEVVVFADSDGRPPPGWMRTLVGPLAEPGVGAASSYRWYVPSRGGWSLVRSAWNAVGTNVLFSPRYGFAWGGAIAIRRETAGSIGLAEAWNRALVDDLALTDAVKAFGLSVRFVPQALVPTFEDCDRAACLEWTDRQTMIVAAFHRRLWNYAATTYGVYAGIVVLGVLSLVLVPWLGMPATIAAVLFLSEVPLTLLRSLQRLRTFRAAAPDAFVRWTTPAWRFALAGLAVPWLIVRNLWRTRRPTFIEWRGRRYALGGYPRR